MKRKQFLKWLFLSMAILIAHTSYSNKLTTQTVVVPDTTTITCPGSINQIANTINGWIGNIGVATTNCQKLNTPVNNSPIKYLGTYTSQGKPNYLASNDTISNSFLLDIKTWLPEYQSVPNVHPQYLSQTIETNVVLSQTSDVYVTFVYEGADYKNVLGFYTYNKNNPPNNPSQIDSIKIIFPNASLSGSGGDLAPGNRVKIGNFPANTGIGWVIFANGWNGSSINTNATKYYSDPGFNPEVSLANRKHTVLLRDTVRGLLLYGFEDLSRAPNSGADNDFNDIIFYVKSYPTQAISLSNSTITNNAPAVFPIGQTIVRWKASNGIDSAICNQPVIITPLTINCPPNINVFANTWSGNIGNATSNCITAIITNNTPTIFQPGTTSVTWTAKYGTNIVTCTQLITVTPMTITCPATILASTNSAECTWIGNIGTAISNNPNAIITNNAPLKFYPGNTIITWTATVGSYVVSCNQLVTIDSNQHVTNNLDDGIGSLRYALNNVCENGTIYFDIDCPAQNITLTTGSLIVSKNVLFEFTHICNSTGISITGGINNLIINSNKTLTLSGNTKFTFGGCIQNNNGINGLVINSGASLIINCCDLYATAKRTITSGWHLFGSPFVQNTGASLGKLIPAGGSVQLNSYTNGTGWISTVTSPYYYFALGVGYAVRPSATITASLSGKLICKDPCAEYSMPLIYNGTSATQSWNLISNPYTSYINWNVIAKSPYNTNVSPTLYLWDNLKVTPSTGSITRTYNAINNVGVPAGTTGLIAPFQGFFVKAVYTSPRLIFPLSAKTHGTSTYYKEANNETAILVRLKLESNGLSDELVICKNDNSSIELEEFDSEKMLTDQLVSICSKVSSGEQLVINTINKTENTIIPLGLKGYAGMNATLTAFALKSNIPIYLEDKLKGKIIRLFENVTYDFTLPYDNIIDRFFIRFDNISSANLSISVYPNPVKNELNVSSPDLIKNIQIFNIIGQVIMDENINDNHYKINTSSYNKGIYFIQVESVNKKYLKKFTIK